MSASERLTRGCIEAFRVACAAWIPGRVAELDREKFSNNPSVALGQLNQICDLALRALNSETKAAEDMRERAAKVCDAGVKWEPNFPTNIQRVCNETERLLGKAIRALPLSADEEEEKKQ